MPVAAGIIIGIGNTSLKFTDNFSLCGIALGTIVAMVRLPPGPRGGAAAPARTTARSMAVGHPGVHTGRARTRRDTGDELPRPRADPEQ